MVERSTPESSTPVPVAPMIGPVDVLPFSQKRRFDLHQLLAMNFN